MKIILNQDVVNLGEEGDVVTVKDGYARNYLLPTGAAVLYNKTNAAIFASRADKIEQRKIEKRAESASLKEKLDAITVNLTVTAGESGKLFGSVTSTMVQEALAKMGITIERKKLEVPTHAIKMVGTYSIVVHLYESEVSHVTLVIESEAQVKERAKAEAAAKAKAEAEAKAKAEAEAAKVAEDAARIEEEKAKLAMEAAEQAESEAEEKADLAEAAVDEKKAEIDEAEAVSDLEEAIEEKKEADATV